MDAALPWTHCHPGKEYMLVENVDALSMARCTNARRKNKKSPVRRSGTFQRPEASCGRAVLSTLQSEDEEVESALIPFLQAYVSKLRNSQKRGSAVSQVPNSTPTHTDTPTCRLCPL